MVTFHLLLGYILQVGYIPPNPPITNTHQHTQRKEKKTCASINQLCCAAEPYARTCLGIAETQVKFPEFLGVGGGREPSTPLSFLHPAVSASLLSPPSPIPHLPPGIECSQSARWAECIIHRLFWGVCMHARVRTKSWGSRLWSHYRSNGGVLDTVPCQSHLKCKSQMSVKRFITHAPPRFM